MSTLPLSSTVHTQADACEPGAPEALGRLHGDSFTYVCAGLESRACRHSVTLLHTLNAGDSLAVETRHGVVRGQWVLVSPQVPRVLRALGVPFVLVDLEPSHPHYRCFCRAAPATGVLSLDHLGSSSLRDIGNRFFRQSLRGTALDKAVREAVAHLAQVFPKPPDLDERVRWMMSAIDLEPSRSLCALAQELTLSVEHASRLFTRQVGVSLRTYSLSSKIRHAARYMGRGQPLTDVAQMAGFVDSSHFAKVWTRCYGRPPSAFFFAPRTRMDEADLAAWNRPPAEPFSMEDPRPFRPPAPARPPSAAPASPTAVPAPPGSPPTRRPRAPAAR
jgi:AraC-like DNA-binding protein